MLKYNFELMICLSILVVMGYQRFKYLQSYVFNQIECREGGDNLVSGVNIGSVGCVCIY